MKTNPFSLFSVPPNEVEFMNEKGMRVQGEIGPYMVGDTLVITCDVLGGKIIFSFKSSTEI